MDNFGNIADEFCFVCTKCSKSFCFLEDMETHFCLGKEFLPDNLLYNSGITNYTSISDSQGIFAQPSTSKCMAVDEAFPESYIAAEVVELDPVLGPDGLEGGTLILEPKDEFHFLLEDTGAEEVKALPPKRRKCHSKRDYHLNKLTRDPYFKLDNNSYTFKDTLGDWDEEATKQLIILIGRFPKAHFLLQYYFERRLSHWENIHSNMQLAGYTFTILQLRMRWRELVCAYRKICNHNDVENENTSFEYMDEMNDLFGVWTSDATNAMLHLVELSHTDNPASRQRRLGFNGWERITTEMASLGYSYGTLQVEARWRNLVISYKSVIDHNLMPTVEPTKAAYCDQLSKFVHYEPKRRKDYEKYSGKKIKLEKFPENVMKLLIAEYSQNAERFIDKEVNNSVIWDDIQKAIAHHGHSYPLSKLKEIFFAKLKLCDRSMQHNSMPGAIKRGGPHFAELTQIYELYGNWPHVKRRTKTSREKSTRRYEVKLRESMQTWHSEESRSLLRSYAQVLTSHSITVTRRLETNPIWCEVAQLHEKLGYGKRSVPEILIQIGLLQQGYAQGNKFPFRSELHHIQELENRKDYSPGIFKHNGGAEILYWSHKAVYLMLDLYLEIQPLLPYSSLSAEVYTRISKEMNKQEYHYTAEDISNELRDLLVQYTMSRHKIDKSSAKNWGKRKSISLYKEKLHEVMQLRDKLSLTFANGMRPMSYHFAHLIYNLARKRAHNLFCDANLTEEEVTIKLKVMIYCVRRDIRKIMGRKPPVVTKICVQLLSGLSYVADNLTDDPDLIALYKLLEKYNYQTIITEFIKESQNGTFKVAKNMLVLEKLSVQDESDDNSEDTCVLKVGDAMLDTNLSSFLTKEFDMSIQCPATTEPSTFADSSLNSVESIKVEPLSDVDSKAFTLEEAMSNFSKKENSKSFIFLDQDFGTMTTVQQPQANGVTCISFDDISMDSKPFS